MNGASSICLSLHGEADFSSRLKMNVLPSALCHFSMLLSLFLPLLSLSFFQRYPLYSLSIFSKPSLYITHTHSLTRSSLLAPPGSLLPSHSLRPPSLSEHISSKVSSQVTLTLISLTAAKHRRLERTHCLKHAHTQTQTHTLLE